jgi:spermidine synthase
MSTASTAATTEHPRVLLLFLALFAGSGCAALIYEIVWLQLLQLVIGSSAISLGVLLGTFMGGMCLGSLLLPRLLSPRWHPLRVYALLELAIGGLGLLILFGMPSIEALYTNYAGHGTPSILLRAAVAGLCLLPPTLLMGATLPAIARWVAATPTGVSWLGWFYCGNIAGAVFGCLLAGFYLLRVHDVATATFAAAGLNLAVAATALVISTRCARPAGVTAPDPVQHPPGAWSVYLAIALSGMSALGAEVVWTRLLTLLLGGTVYTFSLILAVFLIGLGIGSSAGALLARKVADPRRALAVCQLLLIVAITWTAFLLANSLPYWPIVPALSPSPWHTMQLDLLRCLWTVLAPACFWGASFPLALAATAVPGEDAGRLVGRVYAANTIGAIAGALAFSTFLIPTIGSAGSQRVLIGLAAAAAVIVLTPRLATGAGRVRLASTSGILATLALAVVLGWTVAPMPWIAIAYGRQTATWMSRAFPDLVKEPPETPPVETGSSELYCTYVGEGMNDSVAVTMTPDGVRNFHSTGKIQASTLPDDMRVQRMLGHLPALLHKKPEKVLIVACGAGVTAGCFLLHPDVKRIVICDIERLVPTVVTPMFGDANYHIVDGIAQQNPRMINGKEVEVIYDDGRHFLKTTREKFDIITSDPIDPWVKGCAALNTLEYYQMCRDHLTPGGNVSHWTPIYEMDLATAKSMIATFFRVFPDGILWSNERAGFGYQLILYGQPELTPINIDDVQKRLDRPDFQAVKQSLSDVGFGEIKESRSGEVVSLEGAIDLLATYLGQASSLQEWTADAQINTDKNLRLQYLAGMSLNTEIVERERIVSSIIAHYRFPDRTFVGSPESVATLKEALDQERKKPVGAGPKGPKIGF